MTIALMTRPLNTGRAGNSPPRIMTVAADFGNLELNRLYQSIIDNGWLSQNCAWAAGISRFYFFLGGGVIFLRKFSCPMASV